MVIVEDIPERTADVEASSLRRRIPLQHPSSARQSVPSEPLISLSPNVSGTTDAQNRRIQLDSVECVGDDNEEIEEWENELGNQDNPNDLDDLDDLDELVDLDRQDVQTTRGTGAGGMHEVDDPPGFLDEFFDSLILTVPFTFLYLLLDILVHLQYQHRPSLSGIASHLFRAVPTLGLIVFYSNRHANHPVTISFLMSASIFAGTRLIWLVNKAGWSMTTAQAPPVGTLWILTIIQLPLSRAILALLIVAGWTWYSGMKIMP